MYDTEGVQKVIVEALWACKGGLEVKLPGELTFPHQRALTMCDIVADSLARGSGVHPTSTHLRGPISLPFRSTQGSWPLTIVVTPILGESAI